MGAKRICVGLSEGNETTTVRNKLHLGRGKPKKPRSRIVDTDQECGSLGEILPGNPDDKCGRGVRCLLRFVVAELNFGSFVSLQFKNPIVRRIPMHPALLPEFSALFPELVSLSHMKEN